MANAATKGKLIIFSAPSGAGKTTLVRYLMSAMDNLEFSVSACSRKKRPGEVDGKDYYFMTVDEFKEKIKNGEFIEWEEVYKDHFYGTLRSEVDRIRNSGRHVVFDVDVKGGLNIKKIFGHDALAIFVKPPSVGTLKERLTRRATDDDREIATRVAKAERELSFADKFDVIIVNDDLEKAKRKTLKVVKDFLKK
ncbi:MAG: guanylate kinase [Chlorobi bacterium]|nr:guanylate kinase [Chlorobiota bacterium]